MPPPRVGDFPDRQLGAKRRCSPWTVVGCWADGEEQQSPLAQLQPQAASRATVEYGQIMKHKLSELAGTYLAASNRSLKKGIAQRKTVEEALKQSEKHYKALLEESLDLQAHLRRLTHQILTGQEAEREKISHELRDQIAQTLLGINVRLLTVKRAAKGHSAGLKKEIASTQRLVQESVQSINQFAHALYRHQPS
jgi:signal transduction histidine kinase